MIKRLLLFFFFTYASTSYALDKCRECVVRKTNLCSEECLLVKNEKNLECQKDCCYDYCKHQCTKDHKALIEINKESCSSCLELEYDFCRHECEVGSERKRALCKIECSDSRCKNKCKEKEEKRN